jgi:hypothetical protein
VTSSSLSSGFTGSDDPLPLLERVRRAIGLSGGVLMVVE